MAALQVHMQSGCVHRQCSAARQRSSPSSGIRSLRSSQGSFCSGSARLPAQCTSRRRTTAAASSFRRLDVQAVRARTVPAALVFMDTCSFQHAKHSAVFMQVIQCCPQVKYVCSSASDPDLLPLPQVIPMLAGDATDQTPPDLPSFLFKERIVYLVSVFQ